MRSDIHDALLSLREVAVFACSLLELLLTRILPLAGFLAGYLLLQFGKLLASLVILPARRHEAPLQNSCDVQGVDQELIEDDNVVQVAKDNSGDAPDRQNDLESIKKTNKLEGSASLRHEEGGADAQAVAAATSIADAVVCDDDSEKYGAEWAALDVQRKDGPDTAATEVEGVDNGVGQVAEAEAEAEAEKLKQQEVVGEEQQQLGREGDIIMTAPSDDVQQVKVSSELTAGTTSPSSSSGSTDQTMRRSRRRIRVLPPSLSQIKRTLMERSRRASPSPSSSTPSPLNKQQQRIIRKRTIKPSSSYDNFTRKFRKHFLLDPA